MRLRVFLSGLVLTLSCHVMAQDSNEVFQDALEAYDNGRFQQVEAILSGKVETLESQNQVQAYRLLSLSCLYMDMPEQAEMYAGKLLRLDPYYTSYGDNPRFADILAKLKKGISTVTTASKMAESVEEVPVPLTLITEDMIRASGAVRLQDLLLLYVPGLSAISGLEDNVAMRGVYGLAQETILVMVDGHRLNSQSSNSESFDFRNSVDKIKQIEVLRGPASSLYGNVALTAVVNIITKSGSDMDGLRVSAMTGSPSTIGGTIMLGHGNLQSDYSVWGSIFNSKGQAVKTGGTTHYIGAYNSKPSFDLGAKLRYDDVNIEITGQHGHPVPYYNLLSLGDAFSYDEYGKVNGEGPGLSRSNMRADVEWNHSWKDFALSASLYGASERMQIYNVIGDTVPYQIMAYLASGLGIPNVKTRGVRQIIAWDDYSFGFNASGSYNYVFNNGMNGSLVLGVQSEDLIVGDASLFIGADYTNTNNVKHSILLEGLERTTSSYLQVKHYFTDNLIFNGGLRFDSKRRLDKRRLNTVSPRISMIWMPNQVLTLKGGFSHAFVDAPAFYRGSTISLFSGGTELNPEKMDACQAGAILNWKDLNFKYEINLFYNKVSDMVYYNTADLSSSGSTFTNAGQITMGGIENVLQYTGERTIVNVNSTYQHAFRIDNFSSTDGNVDNVPVFMANATAQYALWAPADGQRFWIRANMHAQSAINCQTNDLMMLFVGGSSLSYRQDGYAVFGAGAEWRMKRGLDIALDFYNLTDHGYDIGGQLLRGVPAEGRHCILRLSYNF